MPFTEIETIGGINGGVKMWSSVLDILLDNSSVNVSSLLFIIDYPIDVNYYKHSVNIYWFCGRVCYVIF